MWIIQEQDEEVWVYEPLWSWYGTPLYKCSARRLTFKYLDHVNMSRTTSPAFNAGTSLTRAAFRTEIIEHRLFFTDEEFVMWKMSDVKTSERCDLRELMRKGIVYN